MKQTAKICIFQIFLPGFFEWSRSCEPLGNQLQACTKCTEPGRDLFGKLTGDGVIRCYCETYPYAIKVEKKNTNSVVRKKNVKKLCSLSSLVMLLKRKLFVQLYIVLHGQLGGKNEGNLLPETFSKNFAKSLFFA